MDNSTASIVLNSSYWTNVQGQLGGLTVNTLLYGILMVLYLFAMHLVYHSKSSGRKLLLILASLMALLSTIQCALRIALVVVALRLLRDALLNGPILATTPTGLNAARLFRSLFFSADIVLVANLVLTDGLLVYRCYCVWGHPRKIFLVIPTALIAATVATGIVTAYDQGYSFEPQHFDPYIVFGINLLTNILISLAIAGRIWWISRAQRALLGPHSSLQHSAIIAIILESGSIYCLALILSMVSLSIEIQHPTISLTIYGSVGQLINIAPMLILVRVGMGYSSPSSPNVSRMVVRPAITATTTNLTASYRSSAGLRTNGSVVESGHAV